MQMLKGQRHGGTVKPVKRQCPCDDPEPSPQFDYIWYVWYVWCSFSKTVYSNGQQTQPNANCPQCDLYLAQPLSFNWHLSCAFVGLGPSTTRRLSPLCTDRNRPQTAARPSAPPAMLLNPPKTHCVVRIQKVACRGYSSVERIRDIACCHLMSSSSLN